MNSLPFSCLLSALLHPLPPSPSHFCSWLLWKITISPTPWDLFVHSSHISISASIAGIYFHGLSIEKLTMLCYGIKSLRVPTLNFTFYGPEHRGIWFAMLAVCAEAAKAGLPSREVKVEVVVDEEEYDNHIDQIEEEFRGLKHAWGVVSAALCRIPGTGRVDLETDVES